MLTNLTIDWEKCFICQNITKENVSPTSSGLATLSTLLLKFSEVNSLGFTLEKVYTNGTLLIENLEQNNAVYHRSCYKKHNQQKTLCDQLPSLIKYRIKLITMSKLIYLVHQLNADDSINLRPAGTLHATQSKTDIEHVSNLTKKWLVMAKTLNDDELIRLLSSGDVVSNELFYHKEKVKCCLAKYHKLYLPTQEKNGG